MLFILVIELQKMYPTNTRGYVQMMYLQNYLLQH